MKHGDDTLHYSRWYDTYDRPKLQQWHDLAFGGLNESVNMWRPQERGGKATQSKIIKAGMDNR